MQRVSFLLLLLIFCNGMLWCQDSEYLRPLLKGKKKLSEAMAIVDAHFKSPETKQRLGNEWTERFTKYWKRWEYYMESRTGPNGEFVNINKYIEKAVSQMSTMNQS